MHSNYIMQVILVIFIFKTFVSVLGRGIVFEEFENSERTDVQRSRRMRRDVNSALDAMKITHNPFEDYIPCFCGRANWLETFSKNMENVASKCMEEYVDIWDPTNEAGLDEYTFFAAMKKITLCSTECIFKGANLLLPDGSLNKLITKTYFLNTVFVNLTYEGTEEVIDTCIDSGTEKYKPENRILTCGTEDSGCNQEAFHFLFVCLLLEMEKKCPEDLKTEDPRCLQFFSNVYNDTYMDHKSQQFCLEEGAELLDEE